MDIDKGIVAACLQAGRHGLKELADAGVSKDMLSPVAADALTWIRAHTREHGEMPSMEFFAAKHGELAPAKDPLSVFVAEVKRRHLWQMQTALANSFASLVNSGDVEKAQERIEEYNRTLRKVGTGKASIRSMWDLGPGVWDAYLDAKAGKMGIPTPWFSVNEMTRGFNPGELIILVARLGIGKTWALIMMALEAFFNGYSVLFVSPEMIPTTLASRAFSLHLNMAYGRLRSGRLGAQAEQVLLEKIEDMKGQQGFDLLSSDFRCTPQSIDDAVAIVKPDIVFVDGMYLVKGEGKNRTDRVANVADELKIMAGDYTIPFVCSTQFNREVKKNDPTTVDIGSIGLSDVIGWDADVAFALVQTDDMRRMNEACLKPLKVREGDAVADVWLNWNFETMNFKEQDAEKASLPADGFVQYAQDATVEANRILDSKEKRDGEFGIPFV